MFEKLVEAIEVPMKQERLVNAWVRPSTWLLMDWWVVVRKEETLTQRKARRLGRQIIKFLKDNHKEQTWKAGETIMMHLEERGLREAWRTLQGWHWEAGKVAAKPCYASMEE